MATALKATKLVVSNEFKAFKITGISVEGKLMINVRQMYRTRKEPDEWKHGRQAVSIPIENVKDLVAYVEAVAAQPKSRYEVLDLDKDKDKE